MAEINKLLATATVCGREYTYRLLRRREAAEVYHRTVSVLLRGMSDAAGDGDTTAVLLRALGGVDFGLFWDVAKVMLRGAIVRDDPTKPTVFVQIDDLDETDYYDDKREELYLAVYNGLRCNYPNSFARLDRAIGGIAREAVAGLSGQSVQSQTSESRS